MNILFILLCCFVVCSGREKTRLLVRCTPESCYNTTRNNMCSNMLECPCYKSFAKNCMCSETLECGAHGTLKCTLNGIYCDCRYGYGGELCNKMSMSFILTLVMLYAMMVMCTCYCANKLIFNIESSNDMYDYRISNDVQVVIL
jgi:hypothetical protein